MTFNEDTIKKVWLKGVIVEGYDPSLFRKDACGAWIMWDKYAAIDSPFGWEIDHVFPQSRGGGDELVNLRPLHIMNNRSKGNDYPSYTAVVTSDGDKNIRIEKNLVVNKETRTRLDSMYKK